MSGETQRIQFVAGQPVADALLRFRDPSPGSAVISADTKGAFEVATYPYGSAPETFANWSARIAGQTLYLKGRGVELWWSINQSVLQCEPEEAQALTAAVVEFTWYERELSRLQNEVDAAWPELDEDRRLAFDVTAADLKQSNQTAARMNGTFVRRARFARLEPHLFTPDPALRASAQKLGTELREKADMETRAEALDAHLEVFEHIYEMASQRMGEFRASHQGHRVEWIIIWLLVAEVTLSLLQVVLKR